LGGRGLGTSYDVYLGLIGKRVVNFLSVLTELFSPGVTAEAPAISFQLGQVDPKFHAKGNVSIPIIFTRIVSPVNAFFAGVFIQRNFVADFLQAKCAILDGNRPFAYLRPLWRGGGLRDNVR